MSHADVEMERILCHYLRRRNQIVFGIMHVIVIVVGVFIVRVRICIRVGLFESQEHTRKMNIGIIIMIMNTSAYNLIKCVHN